jgi:hypothetical protein
MGLNGNTRMEVCNNVKRIYNALIQALGLSSNAPPPTPPPPLIRGSMETAIHEAGHAIIAILHNDTFIVNLITCNNELARQQDPLSNGGNLIRFIPELVEDNSITVEQGEKFVQVWLAGMCAATINVRGEEFCLDNINLFQNDPSLINSIGSDVDNNEAKRIIARFAGNINVNRVTVWWSAFRFTLLVLCDPRVWNCLQSFARELHNHPNQTLNREEILSILTNNGFIPDIIPQIRAEYFPRRYPITRVRLMETITEL